MNNDNFNDNSVNTEANNTGDSLNSFFGNSDNLNTNTPTPPNDINNNVNTDTGIDINTDNNTQAPINNDTHPDGLVNPLTNEGNNQEVKEKKPINKKLFIIIGVSILGLLIIFGIISLLFPKKGLGLDVGGPATTNKDTFFLDDRSLGLDQTYALFDKDGKKIYDFVLSYASDFTNGAAVIEKDDKYALINTKGKEIIPFGKYSHITDNDGVFIADDKNGKHYLLDSTGKIKYTFKDYKDYGSMDSIYFNYSIDGEKILIFDYKGNLVTEYFLTGDEDSFFNSVIDSFNENFSENELYSAIHYNGFLTVFSNKSLKVLYNVKEDKYNKISYLLNDKGILLYDSKNSDDYAVMYSGKITPLECDYFKYLDESKVALCEKNRIEYIVNNDASLTEVYYLSEFLDNKNYASHDEEKKETVHFYVDGKVVNSIDGVRLTDSGTNSYVLYFSDDNNNTKNKYSLVDKSGKPLLDDKYESLQPLDINEKLILPSDNNKRHLADKNGKKLSNDYDRINGNYNTLIKAEQYYYDVYNNNLQGYIYHTGEEVIPTICKEAYIVRATEKELHIVCRTGEKEYKLYSSIDGDLLTTEDSIISSNNNDPYVYTSKYDENTKNNIYTYYTLKGKEFLKK